MIANFFDKLPRFLFLALVVLLIGIQSRKDTAATEPQVSPSFQVGEESNVSTAVKLDQVQLFMENAARVEAVDSIMSQIYNQQGELIGNVLNTTRIGKNISGFGGPTPLLMFVDESQIVLGVHLLENAETPSYLNQVIAHNFNNLWTGLSVQQAINLKVEAVSGATFSSSAIAKNVELALNTYGANRDEQVQSWQWWLKNILAIFVVIFGLFSYFYPIQLKKYRWILLSLSVLILGFWQGKMFSLSLFYLWISNGIPLIMWFLFALFLLSVILAIFQNKSFYCFYVCPFGAAQELMGKITKKKLNLPRKIGIYFGNIREQIVLICMFLLIIQEVNDLSQVEVFSGFGITTASHFVFGLFTLFLILSIFFKKPWCTSFCPTGYLMDLFKIKKKKLNL